jgi:DNA-binding beta-propeller fold protein YncE
MIGKEDISVSQSMPRLSLRACTTVVLIVPVLWFTASALGQENKPPQYQVDAAWPKPVPNNWLIGQVGGLAVDKHDHIWVNQRPRSLTDDEKGAVPNPPLRTQPRSLCCRPAPSVMEFDAEGNLLQVWGGPEDPGKCQAPACLWPETEHGIFVDDDDHVWVSGNGPNDRMLLEFTRDGQFLMMIGGSFAGPPDSNSKTSVGKAAGIFVDSGRKEVYVADGYLNSRVVKFNSQSGAFLKAWGAYGHPPVDPPAGPPPANPTAIYSQQSPNENSPTFNRPVHCVVLSRDGLVYVCDRSNNRIQVFNREGDFQQQFVFDPATRGNGSTWSIALSPDKGQRYLFYVDGENNFFRVINRKSGATLAIYGRSGHNAGQFHWVHQIAVDSKWNIYTGEVDTGKRLQKFVAVGAR